MGNEASNKIEEMVSSLVESISTVSDSSVEIRGKLSNILYDLKDVSLKTSKDVGQQALEQHSRMEYALGKFQSGMKQHDELQNELEEQLSTVKGFGESQLGELSIQADTLSKQKQVLKEARK